MFFIVHAFQLPGAEGLFEPIKLDAENDKH